MCASGRVHLVLDVQPGEGAGKVRDDEHEDSETNTDIGNAKPEHQQAAAVDGGRDHARHTPHLDHLPAPNIVEPVGQICAAAS